MAHESTALLSAADLNKSYGGVRAVREVSLDVGPGEVVGLIGPNGAGKTTLVDLLSGTQSADSGRITLRGRVISGAPSRRARAGLARTFQYPQLAPDLTVWENILLGRLHRRMGSAWGIMRTAVRSLLRPVHRDDADEVDRICAALHISEPQRLWSDLTLGEQRLIEVARALAQEPDVLLLDEPFAGSDAEGEAGIRRAVATVSGRGHGVVLVDHNVDIVASLVERVVLMDQGAVAFEGPPDECLRSPEMRQVYFGTATAQAQQQDAADSARPEASATDRVQEEGDR
ncbi:MAG: ATP-binding cassette domain-containing protein [Nocardiopsaceae bacterium]|nr:ATP-binding cassette domain-containing protein [Nocardiopsaceae bacterium]